MPEALANVGLEPTAVMAVPVLVWRKAHIKRASRAKNSRDPVGITKLIPQGFRSISKSLERTLA